MESTLSIQWKELQADVGDFFGFGLGEDFGEPAWDDRKKARIHKVIKEGLRQFYYPPPLNGVPYDWSFLKPTATLTLASGGSSIALPDDFGGFEGKITIASPTSRSWRPITLVNEGLVREEFARHPSTTGYPMMAAVRPIKGTTLHAGTRSELFLHPLADAEYTVRCPYYILADYLDGTHPYAYGGMAHASTLIESCLAIAEQRYDDTSAIHTAKFLERLAASIALDRRMKPQSGGRNTDASSDGFYRERGDSLVTYEGQSLSS